MLKSNITNLQFILDNKPQYSISFDKQQEKNRFQPAGINNSKRTMLHGATRMCPGVQLTNLPLSRCSSSSAILRNGQGTKFYNK